MNTKVTVAINSRTGGKEFWTKTIPAWLAQDYENFDLVVVSDAATDGLKEFVQELNSPKLSFFEMGEVQTGYGAAKNAAVSHATGDYVLLLDNDILPTSQGYLSRLVACFESLENVAFLGTGLYDLGAQVTKYYGIYYSVYGTKVHKKAVARDVMTSHASPIQVPSYHGGGVLFKKSVWNMLGGYDTAQPFMLDDTDLSARAYAAGYSVYLYNRELLEHIGIGNHDDKSYFAWKFSYYISGIITVMLKNFSIFELYRVFAALLVYPVIYVNVAYSKKNPLIIGAFFKSLGVLLKNMPHILRQRARIQQTRKQSRDAFLYITEPFS